MAAYSEKNKNDDYDYGYDEKPKRTVTRTYALADIHTRFFALLVDTLIVGFLGGLTTFGSRNAIGIAIGILIGVGYQWFFLTRYNGQTPGKMLFGLRVIKTDGTPIQASDTIIRYIGYHINSILMIGWIWALIDTNNQGFHEKLANTYVVKA